MLGSGKASRPGSTQGFLPQEKKIRRHSGSSGDTEVHETALSPCQGKYPGLFNPFRIVGKMSRVLELS